MVLLPVVLLDWIGLFCLLHQRLQHDTLTRLTVLQDSAMRMPAEMSGIVGLRLRHVFVRCGTESGLTCFEML